MESQPTTQSSLPTTPVFASPLQEPTGHGHQIDVDEALDFVITFELERGLPVDHFTSLDDALEWLRAQGLVHEWALQAERRANVDPVESPTLARIRGARAALRELIDATYEHRPPADAAVAEINQLLRAREVLVLVPGPDGATLEHRHEGDPIVDALARLAEPLAREVSGERRERLRICANDRCRWAFYDRSRTGRRRWCDMASCGNRAKAARHRARHGGHGDPQLDGDGVEARAGR